MLAALAFVERAIATVLSRAASVLQQGSEVLSSTPVTNVCSRINGSIFSISLSELYGFQVVLLTIGISVLFIFSLTAYFRISESTPTLVRAPPPAARYDPDIDPQSDLFVDEDVKPQLVAPDTPKSIICRNPSTGQVLGHVLETKPEDLSEIFKQSKLAQKQWRDSNFSRRRKILKVLRNYIIYEQKSLCDISCRDTGKTTLEANLGEILPTLEKLKWLLSKQAELSISTKYRSVGSLSIHKIAKIDYVPLGVILAIAPWNYPFHNLINPISAALFTGNSILVKPSEHTIISSIHYIRIVRRILSLCGEDPNLVQCIVGGPEIGKLLTNSNQINKIFFTGSTNIGKKVSLSASNNLIPTCLELGGKDPFIICDDADLNHTLPLLLRGVFQNSGQNCIAAERIYIHSKIKNQFLEMLIEKVNKIRPSVDMGAMTLGEVGVNNIQELIDDAINKGAKLLVGGKRIDGDNGYGNKGWFYAPTVIDKVQLNMRIANEEVFGPVITIFEWNNDNDLIDLVNNCSFGLGSSIFTENKYRGEYILNNLNVGMGNINDFAANYLCQSLPFGGVKHSGSDRFAGIEGLQGCCYTKSSTRDRFRWLKTTIPKALQYPLQDNAAEIAAEINDLVYNPSKFSKMDNARNLIGMFLFPSWRPRTVGSG